MRAKKTSKTRPRQWGATKPACAFCRQPLHRGQQVLRGLTGEEYHPACRQASRATTRPEKPFVSPIPRSTAPQVCAGCGGDDEPLIHRQGVPWHRECSP